MKKVKVINKTRGFTAMMEERYITPDCNWELYVEPEVELKTKETKKAPTKRKAPVKKDKE